MTRFNYRRFLLACFAAYCSVLCAILFLRGVGGHYDFSGYPYWDRIRDRTNLVPFSTIREQLEHAVNGTWSRSTALRNLSANLLLFAPMGVFLPLLWEKLRRFVCCIRLWLGMILTVEALQVLTLQGSFDIDDVILNSVGFLAGFCVYWIMDRFIREER